MLSEGYRALREAAAWLDLSARGRIRVTGEDRVRLLHAMASNHVQQLKPGEGCYTFFLNAQGRILADASLLALNGALLVDTEPEAREGLYAHLDRYIIADDVVLEDVSETTAAIGVEGPLAADTLARAGAPLPEQPLSHLPRGDRLVVRISTTGAPGFSILAPQAEKDGLIAELEAAGAVPAGPDDARTVRLELGKPRYLEDFDDRHLVHETQLLHGVNFNKGCYLGQEIVERVRSRGGVHRFLVRLEIDARQAPAAGTKISTPEKDVGEITSAAFSPALGKVVALGYVRLADVPAGAPLTAAGRPAAILVPRPLV